MRFDLFQAFRFFVATFASIYAALSLVSAVRRGLAPIARIPHSRMLMRYAVILLLRTPSRAFLPELAQIVALLLLFVFLLRWHP